MTPIPPHQEDIAQGVAGLMEDTASVVGEDREVTEDGVIREETRSDDQLMMALGMWHQK